MTVVTTRDSERIHGMTANAFMSVSLDPPLILISVDNRAAMNTLLPTTRYFGISVLAEGQDALSNHFAGRLQEGLDVPFVEKHDVPVIEGAVAHFVARVVDVYPAGDHTLYVGHVEYSRIRRPQASLVPRRPLPSTARGKSVANRFGNRAARAPQESGEMI